MGWRSEYGGHRENVHRIMEEGSIYGGKSWKSALKHRAGREAVRIGLMRRIKKESKEDSKGIALEDEMERVGCTQKQRCVGIVGKSLEKG